MKIRTKTKKKLQLELTPLIDVVFLLLSFYMLTSSFNKPEGLPMELPEAEAAQTNKDKPSTISIINESEVELDEETVKISELENSLKSFDMKKHSFIVRSDKKSQVGVLVSVLDAIQNSGGKNVSIATTRK